MAGFIRQDAGTFVNVLFEDRIERFHAKIVNVNILRTTASLYKREDLVFVLVSGLNAVRVRFPVVADERLVNLNNTATFSE